MTKKIRSTTSKWSVLGVGLTSIVLSNLLLIFSPGVGAFGGSYAHCRDGSQIDCSGYKCTATEYVSCSCSDANGKVVDSKSCPKNDGDDDFFMLEEIMY